MSIFRIYREIKVWNKYSQHQAKKFIRIYKHQLLDKQIITKISINKIGPLKAINNKKKDKFKDICHKLNQKT